MAPGLYNMPSANIGYSLFIPTENNQLLIVSLHGSGERAVNYIHNWIPDAGKHYIAVLAIDSSNSMGWSGQDIERVITLTRYFQPLKKNRRPIFMVHGDLDPMIPVKYGQQTAEHLRKQGYKVKFDLEKGMKHQHYVPANEKILRWFEKLK